MTGKLTDEQMDQLEAWIGTGPKTFTLLYSITRDGCNASTFHQKCDNQGPTVTVLYNPQGSVYGGYTSVSWQGKTTYVQDDKAFLYQLQFSGTKTLRNFACTKSSQHAIQNCSTYGPTFGGGHDLKTFSGTVNSSGGYFALNGYMNDIGFGNSYDTQGVKVAQVNNGNMNVTELKVYKVADGQRHKGTSTQSGIDGQRHIGTSTQSVPWRKTPELDSKYLSELTDSIASFKPTGDVGFSKFRILLIGPVGSGKSSFYNTVNSVFRGRVSKRAACMDSETTTTTDFVPYDLRTTKGANLSFQLCDTPGLDDKGFQDVIHMSFMLDGHVPDFYEFNRPLTPQSSEFIYKPEEGNKVHCVAIVLDSSNIDDIPASLVDKIKSIISMVKQRGIPIAFILTKIDKVSKLVEDKANEAFKCPEVEKAVNKVSEKFGMTPNSVFPVKNYRSELQLDDNVCILALMTVQQLLYLTEDYMENLAAKIKRQLRVAQTRGGQDVTESDTA